jgi:N-acetylmuramoyl-L-alanine amidase
MPSVLIETGFMTNPSEEKKLNNKTHRVYIASAIFRAIRDYKEILESNV